MRHTPMLPGRYLAAVLFTAIGLIASGCGDSATVNPEVELSRLSVSPGTLQPAFSGGTTQYSVDLTSDTTTVTVTAQAAVSGDTVSIDGEPRTSHTVALGDPGSTTPVSIVVSESSTNSRTYTVLFTRAGLAGNNSLENLAVSPGTLAPDFEPNTLPYTVTVASNVDSINVTPTVQDSNATMTVNAQAATSGQASAITLSGPGQSTTITITVTAQNGTPKTYLLNVSRGVSNNNNLQSIGISPGTLAPSFRAGTTDYTVNVASTVTNVRVTPRLQDTTATMTVNGQATTSGQARTISLREAGLNTLVPIVVTAQDGTQKTYLVEVIRAALGGNNNLQSLEISTGTLSPTFSANTISYTVNVASTVDSVTVTPTLQDTAATMTVNGQATTSGQARTITLRDPGLSTSINIAVTAPNGSSQTYTITVDRAVPPPPSGNNDLEALSVQVGETVQTLSPDFASETTAYTVNVASDVTEVTVIATKSDSNAVISGDVPNSGQADITLTGAGTTTRVSINVTAPNGDVKPYTIDVIRAAPAAPPAPASAPDLIAEDDSCPLLEPPDPNNPDPDGCAPGTSRSDNVTNVATPRFTVSQPAAGETPNLYVDGAKVKEGFDQGANTLTPTAALSDGDHTVTSTVTNAGGESPQSPALTVTINTVPPLRP